MQLRDKVFLEHKTFSDSQNSPIKKAPDFYTVKEVMELFYLDRMGGERSAKTLDFYREHFGGFLKRFPHLANTHVSRHTFANNFLDNGGDLLDLQYLLGHASLKMVENYSRAHKQRRAMKALANQRLVDRIVGSESI